MTEQVINEWLNAQAAIDCAIGWCKDHVHPVASNEVEEEPETEPDPIAEELEQ